MAEKCAVKRLGGSSCGAYRMKDSPYCFLHRPEPEFSQRKALARHQGALAQIIQVGETVPDLGWPKQIHLRRPRDVRRFVSRVMNEVRAGKVEPGLANSLFVGANVLLKTFDVETIERLEVLEQAAKERGLLAGQ